MPLARGAAAPPVSLGKLHWAAGAREDPDAPPLRRVSIGTRDHLQRELAGELNLSIEPRPRRRYACCSSMTSPRVRARRACSC